MNEKGQTVSLTRVDHERFLFRHFLHTLPPGSPIAVARHLAEAAYWVLKKNEPYKEPKQQNPTSSTREET
jgi:hypothetical protein